MSWILLSAYLAVVCIEFVLDGLNMRHLRRYGHEVPDGFEGEIDGERLARISDYTLCRNRVGRIESLLSHLLLIVFLFGGLLGFYDRWIAGMQLPFILSGLLFFACLSVAKYLIDLPFNLYHQFVIEERFGFNTMTWRLWLFDQIKGLLVSAVLFGLLLSGALWLVQAAPHSWWLWVWGFFALFSLFLMYVSPYVIEPLFFKFEPLGQPELEERITRVMEKAGLEISRVFQIDASRRSRHSNAYFTGIGRVKRIVLFDTLLEQLSVDEIVAVLAHEVGHWKKRHVFKRLVMVQLLSLAFLAASWWLVNAGVLPGLIGLEDGSFFAQLMILFLLASLVGFVVSPIWSALSRRDEYQADRFACHLTGDAEALASALVKLSRDNLANLRPHPVYAAFHYSHPPVIERVRRLRDRSS